MKDSLAEEGRHICVVTTACIPWLTGTAVNPTLRAAFLSHCTKLQVTLVVPWLALSDQATVFAGKYSFSQPSEQEECIRDWVHRRVGFRPTFGVIFYMGRYDRRLLGIFPVGDVTSYVPAHQADIAILEEPEHLCWYHCGQRWTEKFNHVVGVMHTNYQELGLRNAGPMGPLVWTASHVFNQTVCAIHTHKIIKLSDAVQHLPRETTCNVHGVAPGFLEAGSQVLKLAEAGKPRFSKGAYALGKMVYGKGWDELVDLLAQDMRGSKVLANVEIDCYGYGEAQPRLQKRAERDSLRLNFQGAIDHMSPQIHAYQVFVNCSTSDVVATTSLEALALGKWVVCAEHPCNQFVANFPTCLVFRNLSDFQRLLRHALSHEPPALSAEQLRQLGWEAATERLLAAAHIKPQQRPGRFIRLGQSSLWCLYRWFLGVELFRIVVCAGNCTACAPTNLLTWDPNHVSKSLCPAASSAAARSRRLRDQLGCLWRACRNSVHIRLSISSGQGTGWLALTPHQVDSLGGWPQQSISAQL